MGVQIFTLKDAKALGEKDEKYGYTYWSNVEEIDIPVMFNSMKELTGFETISAEETNKKTSAKGNDYLRLSKVKVAERSGSQESLPSSPATKVVEPAADQDAPTQLNRIERMVMEILEYVRPLDKVVEPTKDELDGIFGDE